MKVLGLFLFSNFNILSGVSYLHIFIVYFRNWAVELFGGNTGKENDNNSTYSEFNIDIVLTDKGFQHYHDVRFQLYPMYTKYLGDGRGWSSLYVIRSFNGHHLENLF